MFQVEFYVYEFLSVIVYVIYIFICVVEAIFMTVVDWKLMIRPFKMRRKWYPVASPEPGWKPCGVEAQAAGEFRSLAWVDSVCWEPVGSHCGVSLGFWEFGLGGSLSGSESLAQRLGDWALRLTVGVDGRLCMGWEPP
jgi:hypothetical protein